LSGHATNESLLKLENGIGPYLPDSLIPVWNFLQAYPVLLVVLLVTLGYLTGKVLQWLLRFFVEIIAKRSGSALDEQLIQYLTKPVMQTTVILALVAAEKAFSFSTTVDWFLVRVLFTLLLIFWGWAWFRATHIAIISMSREAVRFKLFEPGTRPLFEMGIKLLLVSVLIWIFMALWNIDGTAWLASAGVAGIAVGLAAKDTIANFISGLSIIADAPYKIGDFIVLDTGERGMVTELGMRSTRLLTRDDVEISIPNAVIGNAKITNESGGPSAEHRIRVSVGVAYGTRPANVIKLLEQVATDCEMVLSHPGPTVLMRAFGESALEFELLVWINRPEQRGRVQHDLLVEIEQCFREQGIEIPFPQRDLHLKSPVESEVTDS
jgi:MscS family membrane protein